MDRQRTADWTEVRALISRAALYLIVKSQNDPSAPWEFPGTRISPQTPPEDALRRVCRERLGIELADLVSQPAFVYRVGTRAVTYRYDLGRVLSDDAAPIGYAELRWVPSAQLHEYAFDVPTQSIVDRLPRAMNDATTGGQRT